MANRHIKRCSASLVSREMKIKTTVRYHFIHTRIVIFKKTISVGEHVEKLEPLYTAGGDVKWCSLGKPAWQFLK